MITEEQDVWNKIALLALLDGAHKASKVPADNFAIQKLGFISELNGRTHNLHTAYYKFFRFTYGPYSSQLANDVRLLESLRIIDPESRELTSRGKFLMDYISPEVEASDPAKEALNIIAETSKEWGWRRGWQIVDPVYELTVPVDGRDGEEMKISGIPLNTDILVPSLFSGRDASPFSKEMIEDIHAELAIPADRLNPDSEEFIQRVSDALNRALAAPM